MSKSYANFSKDYDKLEKKIDDNVFRNDELSDEENEKLNEIFNSFRDVKKVLN